MTQAASKRFGGSTMKYIGLTCLTYIHQETTSLPCADPQPWGSQDTLYLLSRNMFGESSNLSLTDSPTKYFPWTLISLFVLAILLFGLFAARLESKSFGGPLYRQPSLWLTISYCLLTILLLS